MNKVWRLKYSFTSAFLLKFYLMDVFYFSVWHQWVNVFSGKHRIATSSSIIITLPTDSYWWWWMNCFLCNRSWFLRPILDLDNLNSRLNVVSYLLYDILKLKDDLYYCSVRYFMSTKMFVFFDRFRYHSSFHLKNCWLLCVIHWNLLRMFPTYSRWNTIILFLFDRMLNFLWMTIFLLSYLRKNNYFFCIVLSCTSFLHLFYGRNSTPRVQYVPVVTGLPFWR